MWSLLGLDQAEKRAAGARRSARCCAGRGATGIERGRRSAHGVRPRPTYFLSETPSTVILRVMRGQSQPRRTRSHGACATSVPQGGEWYPSPGGRGRRQPRLTKRPPLHPAVRYTTHVQGGGWGVTQGATYRGGDRSCRSTARRRVPRAVVLRAVEPCAAEPCTELCSTKALLRAAKLRARSRAPRSRAPPRRAPPSR